MIELFLPFFNLFESSPEGKQGSDGQHGPEFRVQPEIIVPRDKGEHPADIEIEIADLL